LTDSYIGPALTQVAERELYRPAIKLTSANPLARTMNQRQIAKFEENTQFDSDLFWEMANETVGNVHECLLAGQARYLLDEMDARNAPRMAFWLSTLFQTDTIEDIIGERINRDEEMFYYASSGVDNSKTILAEMKCEDPLRSLIMSDVIQVAKVDNIWLVTIFYLNTDPIGAVPEYAPDRASLDKWCASAKALAESNLKMITFSYDVFADSQEKLKFDPSRFQLWRLDHNNPLHPSKPRCTPIWHGVEIVPIVPSNIEFE